MFIFSYWQHFFAIAYMQPLAIVAAAALNLTGVPAELDLSTIYLGFCTIYMPGVNFRVIHECTGIFTLGIYIATVIAFPASIQAQTRWSTSRSYSIFSVRFNALDASWNTG